MSVHIHPKQDNPFSYEYHQWDFPWYENPKCLKENYFHDELMASVILT